MDQICIQIQMEQTGKHIRKLLMENGYSVRDIQHAMGFSSPQAVYTSLSGQSLPSVDNLVVLSKILHTSIDNLLVVDGDFCLLQVKFLMTEFASRCQICHT